MFQRAAQSLADVSSLNAVVVVNDHGSCGSRITGFGVVSPLMSKDLLIIKQSSGSLVIMIKSVWKKKSDLLVFGQSLLELQVVQPVSISQLGLRVLHNLIFCAFPSYQPQSLLLNQVVNMGSLNV